MKIILLVLSCLTQVICLSQDTSNCIIDKYYHENGKVASITQIDSVRHCKCGLYEEYDTTGILIVKGNYQLADSVACKGCFDGNVSFGEERNRGTWTEVEYMDACSFRSGVWEYYHSNGKLQMIGEYSKMIHACYGTSITDFDQTSEYLKENGIVLSDSGIINGWVRYENLKDGVWFYFDENGKKIKEEEFIDGDLIYLKE